MRDIIYSTMLSIAVWPANQRRWADETDLGRACDTFKFELPLFVCCVPQVSVATIILRDRFRQPRL